MLYCPGFQWTADLISTALAAEHGFEETFYARFFLDLVNLFAVGLEKAIRPDYSTDLSAGCSDLPGADL